MKRTLMAAMVLSLLTGTVALADPPQGYDHDRGHDRQEQRHEHYDRRAEHRHEHFNSGRYVRPHGWYAHEWRRGDRLPLAWRTSAYVIPNPVIYHLRPAPRGYYWVRVNGNAVLAAVATGVVVDVAVNLFH